MEAMLPHINGFLNAVVLFLLTWGYLAIRRDDRILHPRVMLSALAVGALFVAGYATQTILKGHSRFPGDDWVRSFFVIMLTTHTVLAVITPPLVLVLVVLALKQQFERHRRLARFVFPIWYYVAVTGLLIYWMNNYLRPQS